MSALDTHLALTDPQPRGAQRLARLVLALHADHRGRVGISLRDLGDMCGVSAQAAAGAIASLIEVDLVAVVEKGSGTAPSVYQLLRPFEVAADERPGTEVFKAVVDHVARERVYAETFPEPRVKAGDALPVIASVNPVAEPVAVPTERPAPTQMATSSASPVTPPHRDHPQNLVGSLLTAAGVMPRPDEPLFWFRAEHLRVAQQILAEAGVDEGQACALLRRAAPVANVQQLRDLRAALGV
ncbi:MAG: hypothetical protein LCH92_08245 [Proteobacteria bacterium]|nr:hypothetical protein [Pseudomonadota bacterium]